MMMSGAPKRFAAPLAAADFQRALGSRPCARSTHFVLHHVPAVELSTGTDMPNASPVDESISHTPPAWRLGLVLPKKQARRAVTRSLMRRQARAICQRLAADLPPGDWVLRLRSPFDRALYPSAASEALKGAVRTELWALFTQACEARQ